MNIGGWRADLAQLQAGLASKSDHPVRAAEVAVATLPPVPSGEGPPGGAVPAKGPCHLRPAGTMCDAGPGGAVHLAVADSRLRAGLAATLALSGFRVRIFEGAAPLLADLGTLPAGCVLAADADLPRQLRAQGCNFPVVAVTAEADVATAVRAMKAGAADVVTHPVRPDDLAAAVRGALAQLTRRQAGESVVQAMRSRVERLTRREMQVLEGMVRGGANKAIAHELGISPRTVEVHRANVMEKLGCRSLSQIIRMAVRLGLATP